MDRLDLELTEPHDLAVVQVAVVESARRGRVRQHREAARAQLGDAGDVVLVRVREQERVDGDAAGAGVFDERTEVAVAVDQHPVRTCTDEIGTGVPALVARCDDGDLRRSGPAELADRVDHGGDVCGHEAIVVGAP